MQSVYYCYPLLLLYIKHIFFLSPYRAAAQRRRENFFFFSFFFSLFHHKIYPIRCRRVATVAVVVALVGCKPSFFYIYPKYSGLHSSFLSPTSPLHFSKGPAAVCQKTCSTFLIYYIQSTPKAALPRRPSIYCCLDGGGTS